MSMRIINPRRLFALICLVAAWAGLEGARTSASAAPPPSGICSVGIGSIDFGQVDVLSGSSPSPINMVFRCDVGLGQTVYFCIGKQKLNMISYPTAGATLTYDITPVNTKAVFSSGDNLQNRGSISIVEKISDNQQMVPPGQYSTALVNPPNAMNVAYSTTDCANAPIIPILTPTSRASANVQASCKVTASNLDFGTTSDLSSAIAAQSQINVRCTNGTGYSIGLDGGLTGAVDPTQRKMKHGADAITYGLYYKDQNGTMIPWGSTIGINVAKGTGSSIWQPITVFGNVPSVQSKPAPGSYSDTIVVSVSY